MAYCRNCGAYIPEGQQKCLACGYDEEAEAKKTAYSGGSAYARGSAEYADEFEELRRQRQEADRMWAEAERSRRQAEQAKREAEFARRESERARREAEYAHRQARSDADYIDRNSRSPYSSAKSRDVALLLCLLVGVTGAHHFYTGRFGTGLLYLFTGGLFGIGWIIDLIKILTGSFRDSSGAPLV